MKIEDINYMKAWTIEWLKHGIETFDERTDDYIIAQSRNKRIEFSALLEEFVDILDKSWEEK